MFLVYFYCLYGKFLRLCLIFLSFCHAFLLFIFVIFLSHFQSTLLYLLNYILGIKKNEIMFFFLIFHLIKLQLGKWHFRYRTCANITRVLYYFEPPFLMKLQLKNDIKRKQITYFYGSAASIVARAIMARIRYSSNFQNRCRSSLLEQQLSHPLW